MVVVRVRCGQGKAAGATTQARVRLRKAHPMIQTYALVYEHFDVLMQDFDILAASQRIQYIEGWCLPIV